MSLTDPPSPIVAAGQEFVLWRSVAAAKAGTPMLEITVDDEWATTFMNNLGKKLPGLLEDGWPTDFLVYSVQCTGPNEAKVLVIPEVITAGGVL
ncbi:MAG TPA: hypothetical protein VFG99_11835 [Chloroflexia bacterium]|nr:hypothetical protein [Chloroflexia bacterium]